MKVRSVIFDLDGTLLNTLDMIMKCNNEIFRKHGYQQKNYAQYRTFVGDGMFNLMKKALPVGTDEQTMKKLIEEVLELYNSTGVESIPPYEGIIELLDELVKREIKISILTNKEHKYAVLNAETIFSKYHFEAIIGDRPGRPLKPAPDGVFEISRITGVPLNETIFVGDMMADILTGKNAGIFTVSCLWGFGNREDLEKHNPDMLISHPLEIIGILS
ncbi:MAG TPA: HAD family hydrolase [bacterium]|nr:HAD family hydrolase [bacterium]HPS31198.1 HAD family hydrolase [bacterium]